MTGEPSLRLAATAGRSARARRDPAGAAGALARTAFDRLERLNQRRAERRLASAVVTAHALGWVRNALSRRWPSPAAVAALFGCGPEDAAVLARRIAGFEARDRLCLAVASRHGFAPLRRLVRWRGDPRERARPPAVVATFHAGAQHAVGAAVADLPGTPLSLRWSPLAPPSSSTALELLAGGLEQRAAALRRALGHLDRGELVVTAADGGVGSTLPVCCLGHPFTFGRGPFFLARQAGVPVVGLYAAWSGRGIECELGAPCDPGEGGEETMAARLAAELTAWLRRRPERIGLGSLRRLLGEA